MAPVCVRPIFLREAGMMDSPISEGLTFDDVLLLPGKSSVLPTEADTTTNFARKLPGNIPLACGAVDTEASGMFRGSLGVKFVVVSASVGSTDDFPGRSRTSSNV